MKKSILAKLFAGAISVAIPFQIVGQKEKMKPQRIVFADFPWFTSAAKQPGSAMVPGLETIFVTGDGKQSALYSMVFKVPPNTAIPAHFHPDDRSCFVLSGLWYFGYGNVRDEAGLKALPPGSSYTEPAGASHFAGTKEQAAVVECTAFGPTGTTFVKASEDLSKKE